MLAKPFRYPGFILILLMMFSHLATAAEAWMIGWSEVEGVSKRSLVSVDPAIGEQRVIGPLGVFDDDDRFWVGDLATNAQGDLYLVGAHYEAQTDIWHILLFRIDTANGHATQLGELDLRPYVGKMSWDRQGRLWVDSVKDGEARLNEIDPHTLQVVRSYPMPAVVKAMTLWMDDLVVVIKPDKIPFLVQFDPETGESRVIRELTESIRYYGDMWEYLDIWDIGFGPDGNLLLRADVPGIGIEFYSYMNVLFLQGSGRRVDLPLTLVGDYEGFYAFPSRYWPWFTSFAFPPSPQLVPETVPTLSPAALLTLGSLLVSVVAFRMRSDNFMFPTHRHPVRS